MAASWVTPVSDEPFLIAVSIWKGSLTYRNVKETGEFTVNVLSSEHVDLAYKAGSVSGRDIDKWSMLGLKPLPSKLIKTPGVDGALGVLECTVEGEVPVGESVVFIASVKAIRVKGDLYAKHGWDLNRTSILMHMHGRVFTSSGRVIVAEKRWGKADKPGGMA